MIGGGECRMEISALEHILFSIMLFVIENDNKAVALSSQKNVYFVRGDFEDTIIFI